MEHSCTYKTNQNRIKEILDEKEASNDWKIRMIEEQLLIFRDWLGVRQVG